MKITFVIHARLADAKLEKFKAKIQSVFSTGFEISFSSTTAESGAKDQVRIAIENGAKYVIIAGGDGSVNEAVNGYMEVTESLRNTVTLGVYPMGTGNDFSKSLKVTKSLNELVKLIQNKSILKVDVCKMNFVGLTKQDESRYFINISDIGIGGLVVEKMKNSSRKLGASLTYFKSILSSFFTYKKQPIRLKSPKMNWKGEIMSLCMANGKYFGSGMCIAPDAQLNDGRIQLTILGNISVIDYIRNLGKIKKGIKIFHKKILYTSVEELTVESAGEECPVDMDGEFVGYTPIEVKIHPKNVNFLANF
jgi:YegS/Rv2252/BmrU family lipid kinase